MYCTDTNSDGVDLESPQGLGSDIPTILEVNIQVHLRNFLTRNPIPEDNKLKNTCYLLEHTDPVKGLCAPKLINNPNNFKDLDTPMVVYNYYFKYVHSKFFQPHLTIKRVCYE